jgi:YVTN family beta-propeller protein
MELHSRQPRGTKVRFRPGLLATVAALCIAAGLAHSQYVEDSIDVGGACVGSLVYNSRSGVVYGASEHGPFFAISCSTNTVVANFSLGAAHAVCFDSLDNKAYCTFTGNGRDSLAVIDGRTHSRVKTLPMASPMVPVWDPVSNRLYVSCGTTDRVAVMDCASDSVLTYIPVGASPRKMYINTLRRRLYVLNYDGGTVSVVDLVENRVVKTVAVGGNPDAGYYCQSADKFYCGMWHDKCAVIGGVTDTVVARIYLPGIEDLFGATGNEKAGLVYLGTFTGQDDYVATVLAEKDSVIATSLTGRDLWGLACSDQSGLVYSASSWSDEVYVLTCDGSRIVTTLHVGGYPFVFAIAPRYDRLYLAHMGGNYVYVLRDNQAVSAAPPPESCGVVRVTPNPFTWSVAVVWNSPIKEGHAARVYAQDGRLVRQARIPAGEVRWVWDGRDDSGALFPPGVYILETGSGVRAKVVKLK